MEPWTPGQDGNHQTTDLDVYEQDGILLIQMDLQS